MLTPRAAGRALALGLVVVLLLVTAWVSLVGGAVVFLAGVMGPGFALLTVGGGLLALVLVMLVVASAMQGERRHAAPAGIGAGIPAALLQGAMSVMSRPAALRSLLALLAVLFGLAAVLMPGAKRPDDGDKS